MFDLEKLLRDNIKHLKPYSSARDEYKGNEGVFLDANENPFGSASKQPFNRYPDPLQRDLKELISRLKRIDVSRIFLGNGSDEPIDLIFRAVCSPGTDNVIVLPPTYGMYEVCAGINDVEVRQVPLTSKFQIDTEAVLKAADKNTRLIFICSPNNPTGNCMNGQDIEKILKGFEGIVVLDEAYIDFAPDRSFTQRLKDFPNLMILQTFSKAWGLAALRLGMAFASEDIIKVLNKIKYPYNINVQTQQIVMDSIKNLLQKEMMVEEILDEREKLKEELENLSAVVQEVYPSDANFLLVKTIDGNKIYDYLVNHKIITRNRSSVKLCEGCLRITVGKGEENRALVEALKKYN